MNEAMLDIYIKENPEMQLIGSAIKLVLRERKRQDAKWGSNRNLDDMTWLTILTEEVGESAEAILKNLPEKVDEVVQITAVALAWLECILRVAEQRDAPVHAEPKCPSCVGMGVVDDEGFILKCFACDGTGILNRSAGG